VDQSWIPLLVPSKQNLLLVLVALEVALPKKSEKVAQHEPTAQVVLSLQATLEEVILTKVFTLNIWLQSQTLLTLPMEKVTLWNSMGAQMAAAVVTAAVPLVSLAQQ
jgi:hypothetical protein